MELKRFVNSWKERRLALFPLRLRSSMLFSRSRSRPRPEGPECQSCRPGIAVEEMEREFKAREFGRREGLAWGVGFELVCGR